MLAKYPSLELNWLPKPKDVSLPDVCFVDSEEYSGCYYQPEKTEVEIGGTFYSLDRGLIVGNTREDPATIAHEFRHHLQYVNGLEFDSSSWAGLKGTYRQKIESYYCTSVTELDALIFEVVHYPDNCNQQWFEWVVNSTIPPAFSSEILFKIY